MAYPGELAYYQSVSGLPADRTLAEHKRAYFLAAGGAPADASLSEAEYQFYLTKTSLPRATTAFVDARYAYYAAQTASSGTAIGDLMAAFFANPPSPASLTLTPPGPFVALSGVSTLIRAVFASVPGGSVYLSSGPSASGPWTTLAPMVENAGGFEVTLDFTSDGVGTYFLRAAWPLDGTGGQSPTASFSVV